MFKATKLARLLKPSVKRLNLLFIAGVVWTFAGSMILMKGISMLIQSPQLLWLKLSIAIAGGVLFYVLLFNKISKKHIQRILSLEIEKPCVFSFFNLRGYIMMASMITFGIILRKTGIIPIKYLAVFYICMAIPLLTSAIRFYYAGIRAISSK